MKYNKHEHVDLKQLVCFFFFSSFSADWGKYDSQPALSLHDWRHRTDWSLTHLTQQILPGPLDRCKQVSRTSGNITCCSRFRRKPIGSCWLHTFSAQLMLPSNHCISHTLTASIRSSSALSHSRVQVWCKITQNYSSIFIFIWSSSFSTASFCIFFSPNANLYPIKTSITI